MCDNIIEDTSTPEWVVLGGFIPIVFGVMAMFWGFGFICEEYCVPAITVLCKRHQISDDIAGAILIGASLSLPSLFASYVGLFFLNSTIGVGTIIGGNIFNNFVNLSVSIVVAPNKTLKLDGAILTREILFYLASTLLLIWSIKHELKFAILNSLDISTWALCLEISWIDSFVLVMSYGVYCLIEAYSARIAAFMYGLCNNKIAKPQSSPDIENANGSEADEEFLYSTSGDYNQIPQPVDNIGIDGEDIDKAYDLSCTSNPQDIKKNGYAAFVDEDFSGPVCSIGIKALSEDISPKNGQDIPKALLEPFEFVAYKKSEFYSRHNCGCIPASRVWQLCHFTLDAHGLRYRRNNDEPTIGPHMKYIDLFSVTEIKILDRNIFEFALCFQENLPAAPPRFKIPYPKKSPPTHLSKEPEKKKSLFPPSATDSQVSLFEKDQNIKLGTTKPMKKRKRIIFPLRVHDLESFQAIVDRLDGFIANCNNRPLQELKELSLKARRAACGNDDDDGMRHIHRMFLVPNSLSMKILFYSALPMRYLMYLTVPDVRLRGSEHRATSSILMCVVWLALESYVLITGLSILSNLAGINSTIFGLTFGAWASSYPALWSSVVVARNGFGDMVAGNAIGSNTFNIFIGLGLPWLTYSVLNQGNSYNALRDDGVVFSLLVLFAITVVFHLFMAASSWTLQIWMVPIFIFVYFAYLGYLVYISF